MFMVTRLHFCSCYKKIAKASICLNFQTWKSKWFRNKERLQKNAIKNISDKGTNRTKSTKQSIIS